MIPKIHYQIIYRNGEKTPVADFLRNSDGRFIFEYLDNPKYEFPGFDIHTKKNFSDTLWEQIGFRVPNVVREEHPNTPLEELLQYTSGKLITDHFEFQIIE
ncbi:MAG: hypothetical protein AAB410_01200 [Patescibacteria group bacterium]